MAAAVRNIESRFLKLVVDQLGIDDSDLQPKASFRDDLGADSLDCVELQMGCEEEFGIDIPDHDWQLIQTVQQGIDYVTLRAKK